MSSEAQRLIGISLTKIAQSRAHRGGVSLHKNLLVATVLQKARYIFMEEAYNMVRHRTQEPPVQDSVEEDLEVGLTAEEAGLISKNNVEEATATDNQQCFQPSCSKCLENQQQQDKENHPPSSATYVDLDKPSNSFRERLSSTSSLKRRRSVSEWETEEAVKSILPKKTRLSEDSSDGSSDSSSSGSDSDSGDDSVFLDDATLLSNIVSKQIEQEKSNQEAPPGGMEIDRITSLVSIFSFSVGSGNNGNSDGTTTSKQLNRSVSTPDLCSAQAKDAPTSLQQRPFLTMMV
ncbi:uncharacterized protein LOC126745495 [Anthonomus grandis grandis]|uniref:uncharacterized protein LOC126745495 n=1 Tax=Anthonomus grandis grandis TaxID=2921223 RepID=UPI002165C89E|nr:uncharacterized protein LOC126745495 [Anthonomus grandis grandis]